MRCKICGEKTYIRLRSRGISLCEAHLDSFVIKRIRKVVSRYSRDRKIKLSDGCKNRKFVEFVLERLGFVLDDNSNVVIISDSLDDCACELFKKAINMDFSSCYKLSPVYKKEGLLIIRPFSELYEDEILLFCKVHNIEFKPDTNFYKELVKEIEHRFPGILLRFYKDFFKKVAINLNCY